MGWLAADLDVRDLALAPGCAFHTGRATVSTDIMTICFECLLIQIFTDGPELEIEAISRAQRSARDVPRP